MAGKVEKLTPLAIAKLLEGDALNQNIVVQVFDIKKTKNDKLSMTISDGDYCTLAYYNGEDKLQIGKDELSIICINNHSVFKNNVAIMELKFVAKYSQKLGTPVDWASRKDSADELKASREFKLERIEKVAKTEPKKIQMSSDAKTTPGKSGDYESIDDLYIGLPRWTILCRVTRKSFKESAKKGTKILQIELVDRSKKKIIGTFFGDAAVQFKDEIKEDRVYEISKGRLVQGDYNNSKNQKMSKFSIVFDMKSHFNEVSDVNVIAKSEDTAITLGQLYNRHTMHQQFDIVAYVVEVKPETSYQKQDKTTTIKQVVLADPDAQITMNANLWRWRQQFGPEMVGKVVIFSRFIMKQYKESVSIHSGVRSCININHGHTMRRYEGQKLDVSGFKAMTEIRERAEEDTADMCMTTKDLENKIVMMRDGETIKSLLYVWINRFAFAKKWSYQACPKCRKAASKYSKCNNSECGYAIEETTLNFSMGVEVSDFYGSLWVTAYDEFAKKIFHDMGNTAANQLESLSKDELSEKLENYLYQPFRMKIVTKKDNEGRVRHNAGRLYEVNDEKLARTSLKRIHELLGRN